MHTRLTRPTLPTLLASLLLAACASQSPPAQQRLDRRTEAFLDMDVASESRAEKAKEAFEGSTFETFIYSVYSGSARLDSTADNAETLAGLEKYLDREGPRISSSVLEKIEAYYVVEANRTQARGRFLDFLKGYLDR